MEPSKFMSRLICDIANHYGAKTKAEARKILDNVVHPKQAKAGFLELVMVVVCPCGEPITCAAQPPQDMENMLEEARAAGDPDADKVVMVNCESKHFDAEKHGEKKPKIATNMGMTVTKCDECGRQFVLCWEMDSCEVDKDTKFPWDGEESPPHPASGLSFGGDSSGAVH